MFKASLSNLVRLCLKGFFFFKKKKKRTGGTYRSAMEHLPKMHEILPAIASRVKKEAR